MNLESIGAYQGGRQLLCGQLNSEAKCTSTSKRDQGEKFPLPEYVEGILERERRKDRIEQRKQHRLNGYNNGNGNGNGSPR